MLHAALSNGDEDEKTVYATITRTVAVAARSLDLYRNCGAAIPQSEDHNRP